ncbi:hypothetical protein AMAG_16948 [Allomyces macrogynus ATCC 38327]|uniref:Uncharacterized protein n=1 Tax=Allomyces macrogynus (strain ATCC 38327) TaxID=578462 RepID=A0A0L0TD54_ALLM3|nr:hypothetical protein AMAG_16948 [Allomyces macrogynus ATCC 38327]|eukprot:KNE72843.1 hypothetical protein AMAG_16948 [Allomyces macrogynus ATCC 38327]
MCHSDTPGDTLVAATSGNPATSAPPMPRISIDEDDVDVTHGGSATPTPATGTPNKPPISPLFTTARAFGAAAGSSPRPGSGIALQPLHAGSLVKNTLGLWAPLSPTVSRPVSPVLAAFHDVPGCDTAVRNRRVAPGPDHRDQFAMRWPTRLRDVQAAAAAAVARSAATTSTQPTTTTMDQPAVAVTQPAVVVDRVPSPPPPPTDTTSSPRLRQAARHLSLRIPDSAVAVTPTPAPSPAPQRDHDDDEDIYQEPRVRPHPERFAASATPTTAPDPATTATPSADIPVVTTPTRDNDEASLASDDSAESDGSPTLLDPVAGMPITDIMTAAKDLQVWVRVTVLAMRQTPAVAGMLFQRAHRRASSALSVASSMRGLVGQKAMCCTPM